MPIQQPRISDVVLVAVVASVGVFLIAVILDTAFELHVLFTYVPAFGVTAVRYVAVTFAHARLARDEQQTVGSYRRESSVLRALRLQQRGLEALLVLLAIFGSLFTAFPD